MTALEELRKKYKDQVVKAGGNLTVTAMLVKVLATALQKFPQFNASIDPDRGEIIYKKYVNVGVAVDTDRGLLVPVIKRRQPQEHHRRSRWSCSSSPRRRATASSPWTR